MRVGIAVIALGLVGLVLFLMQPRQAVGKPGVKPRIPDIRLPPPGIGGAEISELPSSEIAVVVRPEDLVSQDVSITPEHLISGRGSGGDIVIPEVGEEVTVPVEVSFKVDDIGEYNNSRYYLIKKGVTFKVAKGIAARMGGHILTLSDEDELKFVRKFVKRRKGTVWLGITDEGHEGTWTWVNGEAVNWTNWNRGEPNNAGGNENVAELYLHSGKWNDTNGEGHRWLVIERD